MNQVHCADAAKFIAQLPNSSVDLVLTLPPYCGLRDYDVKGQIGLESHPQQYIEKLASVFEELKRVLKPHGSLFLNLGDTYCSMKGSCFNAGGGRTSLAQPAYKTLARDRNPNRMLAPDGGWLQPKQLLMIPARVAIAMQADGWILRNDIIWSKPNGMPSSVKDRLTSKYEHVFHFVKSRRYFYDLDAIRGPHRSLHPQGRSKRTAEGRTSHTKRHLLGLRARGNNYIGHPRGKNPGDILRCSPETRNLGTVIGRKGATKVPSGKGWMGHPHGGMARIVGAEDPRWLSPKGKNPGDFWTVVTRPFTGAHFAVFPEKLCELPIKATCPPKVCVQCGKPNRAMLFRPKKHGRPQSTKKFADAAKPCSCDAGFRPGTVFDPFAGSGTALVVAKRLGRLYLGCDLNPSYVRLANERLQNVSG